MSLQQRRVRMRTRMWYQVVDSEERDMSERLAARGLDTTVPNVARIYDYYLGGKDNFAADRDAADRVLRAIPHAAEACRHNRDFLVRVVKLLADAGVRQFLDIGSGLPTRSNVHEIAQAVVPESRVVYVDYDHIVASHARALLEKGSHGVLVVEGDLRDPEKILTEARGLLDFGEPVAVLLIAVLHFLTDGDQPYEAVRSLTGPLAAGSAVAVSHITDEAVEPDRGLAARRVYQGASAPAVPRSREAITRFLDGLELTGPGVTDINLWPVKVAGVTSPLTFYGGVALKPSPVPRS